MAKGEKLEGKALLKEWLKDLIIAVIIAVIIIQFVKPTIVKETSMEPNFYENDYLFVYKKAYSKTIPKKGDVIIFHSDLTTETGKKKLLIKRVIGVPGDVVSIRDGEVYINGKLDDQSYTSEEYTIGDIIERKVGENELFCMGDNRPVSVDSRDPDVGNVTMDRVVGKVVFRAFPFSKFGKIENPYDKK